MLVDHETMTLMDWHVHYKNGILPVAGGLLDQSAYFVDSMREIEHWAAVNMASAARGKRA